MRVGRLKLSPIFLQKYDSPDEFWRKLNKSGSICLLLQEKKMVRATVKVAGITQPGEPDSASPAQCMGHPGWQGLGKSRGLASAQRGFFFFFYLLLQLFLSSFYFEAPRLDYSILQGSARQQLLKTVSSECPPPPFFFLLFWWGWVKNCLREQFALEREDITDSWLEPT